MGQDRKKRSSEVALAQYSLPLAIPYNTPLPLFGRGQRTFSLFVRRSFHGENLDELSRLHNRNY